MKHFSEVPQEMTKHGRKAELLCVFNINNVTCITLFANFQQNYVELLVFNRHCKCSGGFNPTKQLGFAGLYKVSSGRTGPPTQSQYALLRVGPHCSECQSSKLWGLHSVGWLMLVQLGGIRAFSTFFLVGYFIYQPIQPVCIDIDYQIYINPSPPSFSFSERKRTISQQLWALVSISRRISGFSG